MSCTLMVLITSLVILNDPGPRPVVVKFGSDPARGVLVNRTPGSRPFDAPDPALPSVVFIHGFNPAPRLVHFEMTRRLAESIARRAVICNVLEWDWNAATCDSLVPKTNSINSVVQGQYLAAQLARSGVDPGRTHLIGHSAGGMVATSAAHVFARQKGRPVAQLTLLEPATFYHRLIFEQLQAGSLAPRVENFWTSSPSAYGGEVQLAGVQNHHVVGKSGYRGVIHPLRSDHISIFTWYLTTVEDRTIVGGFNSNQWIDCP